MDQMQVRRVYHTGARFIVTAAPNVTAIVTALHFREAKEAPQLGQHCILHNPQANLINATATDQVGC
jgi:hypothetical protein